MALACVLTALLMAALILALPLATQPAFALNDSLPSSYNANPRDELRNTSPARLQSPWETCWAFAATGAMESDLLASGLVDDGWSTYLSPKHLAYFGYLAHGEGAQAEEGSYPKEGFGVYSLGGSSQIAIAALSSGRGPAWEDAYPYRGANGAIEYVTDATTGAPVYDMPYSYASDDDWSLDASAATDTASFQLKCAPVVNAIGTFENPDDKEHSAYSLDDRAMRAVKRLVLQHGGASLDYFAGYGTVNPEADGGVDVWNETYAVAEHAVVLVGWDDSYSRENFQHDGRMPEGDGAWICKNSLGSYYRDFPNHSYQEGFDGYFHLSYYDRSIAGITVFDLVASADAGYGTTYIDQYDYLGRASYMDDLSNSTSERMSYANIFTAQQDQTVTHASLELYSPGCAAEIRVYKLFENASSPIDGVLASRQATRCDEAGFYKVALDTPLALRAGERYSIVETVRKEDGWYTVPFEATGWDDNAHYSQTVVLNPGESWLEINGTWVDATQGKAGFEDATNHDGQSDVTWTLGNVMVKGYARAYDEAYAVDATAAAGGSGGQASTGNAKVPAADAIPWVLAAALAIAAAIAVAAIAIRARKRP